MKLFTGWVVSAGLVVAATAAQAQVLPPYGVGNSPYRAVSDVGGPYAAMPPEARVPPGYGPRLLPPEEVYTVLRESGFSPLGIPRQRGFVYTISVIDRGGDDGRLVIDARTGRILRFLPANRMGDNFDEALTDSYGPLGPPPLVTGAPRPPRAIPRVASRTPAVPIPKASPHAGQAKPGAEAKPLAAKPATPPAQQSAAAQTRPAEPPTTGQAAAPAAAPPVEAKPAPQILPTQDMPQAQGLE
ncbi:hypothetical protein KMZ68_22610 [Bradyrhizobium sediminis]|uniref:PepSY domain-containing protein n=1 Tax=Bradyrhizobium sediminis TaxID=2840469 RepID=A0A975NM51_9BRAD|nr:hypothetical protein [Bradyrhizobium sediminis]QWG17718.1 hypothetical protein KMZ68_22610 [Bradyrhizobium sediminis]